jgi:peptidoglycan-associated lipoprotein
MIGVFGLALASVSCSAVKPEELDAELAQVRQEMQQADDQLSGRIDGVEGRMNSLESDLRALRNDYNATVERMQGMLKFNVPVHFAFDEAAVRELDKPVLDRFAAVVKQYYGDALVTVEGFADAAGSEAYNVRLGKSRADAVKDGQLRRGARPPGDARRSRPWCHRHREPSCRDGHRLRRHGPRQVAEPLFLSESTERRPTA